MLTDKERPPAGIDLGATRDGYEEYGHVVDLNGGERREREAPPVTNVEPEIIAADPVDKLKKKLAVMDAAERERPKAESKTPLDVVEEKMIRVPVRISRSEVAKEIQLNVIIEIEVE